MLFTDTNAVKFPSAVTRSSCTLPLCYYRASTFLPCRISNLRWTNSVPPLLWTSHSDFLAPVSLSKAEAWSSRTQLSCYQRINTFVLCRISKPTFITIRSTTFGTRPSILHPSTKKNFDRALFSLFLHTPRASVFSKNEADNLWIYFRLPITCMFHLRFWQNLCHYFYYVCPTNRPELSLK